MTEIKAIETRYAGCRFRSRLEARWAVFFDTLGVEWEYESQGFEIPERIFRKPTRYLPDFWLPTMNVYAEVKGTLDQDSTERLLNSAAVLSSPEGGCGGGHDLVVLGPIPKAEPAFQAVYGATDVPSLLHMHKGDLFVSPWRQINYGSNSCPAYSIEAFRVANDAEGWEPGYGSEWGPVILKGFTAGTHRVSSGSFIRGYGAARSARFEHGERG